MLKKYIQYVNVTTVINDMVILLQIKKIIFEKSENLEKQFI